jgi:hypothetical protein
MFVVRSGAPPKQPKQPGISNKLQELIHVHIHSLLTPQQTRLLEPLRKGHPVPVERLVAVLYADRPDGGPDDAIGVVQVQICKLRARLAPHGVTIVTVGRDGYMVHPPHRERLSDLLASWLPAAIEQVQEVFAFH